MHLPLPSWKQTLRRLGFRKLTRREQRSRERSRKLNFESLERRELMATLYWDPDGNASNNVVATGAGLGGSGNWDTSSSLWYDAASGTNVAWNSSAQAEFKGTAGTVTASSGLAADSLVFFASGYIVQSGSLALSGTSTIDVGAGLAATVGTQLTGTGALTKTGDGTLTLTAANTYSGATTVSGGTLALQNTYASNALSIAAGATLELYVASGTRDYATSTITGAGTLQKTGAGTARWASTAATFALSSGGLIDVQAGTLVGGNSANEVWTSNLADLNVASGAIFDGVEANVRIDALTGSGTVKTGYSGAGYSNFTIGVDNGGGTFSGVISNSTSTGNLVKSGSGTQTLAAATTYSGSTTISGGTLVRQNTYASNAHAIAAGATLELYVASGSTSFASSSFTGAGTLKKTGAGTALWGTSAATFALASGALIDVQQGQLTGGSSANEVWTNNFADLNVAAGAIFDGVEANVRVDALTGSGTVKTGYNGAGYSSFTIGIDNGSGTFSGVMANSAATGKLTKSGSGTQTLTGNNTYTGATTVGGGSLIYEGTYGSSAHAIASGAMLELYVASGSRNFASTTFSGAGTLRKSGAGTAVWSTSAATFALSSGGLIDVQAGTLTGGSNANEVWTSNLADLNVASGATFDGVEANVRIDALTGSGTVKTGYNGAGYTQFTIGVDNGSGTFSGALTNSTATGHLLKTGTGKQTLNAANSYSGNTSIQAGTLNIQHAAALGSALAGTSVATGAALEVQGGITVVDEQLTLAGSGVASGGALRNISGDNTWSGPIALEPPVSINSDSGTLTLENIIDRVAGLTVGGAGTVDIETIAQMAHVAEGGIAVPRSINLIGEFAGLPGLSGPLTFAITGNTNPTALSSATINHTTSTLTIVPNAAAPGASTELEVTATDGSSNTATLVYHITVTDNLLTNGGFEQQEVTNSAGWETFTSIPGWTLVSGPNFELQENLLMTAADAARGGDQYAELDAHPSPGLMSMSQPVSTMAGGTYRLRFAFAGRPGTTID